MIGHLRGTLLERRPPTLIVEAQGVGYEVEAPLSAFYDLPADGDEVTLHVHMVVREDAQLLFGFRHRSERDLFRSLIRVNGVGPKLALTLLSGIEPREFVRCVQEGDVATLVRLPGVGRKTAERLVVEMRDRLAVIFGEMLPPELDADSGAAPQPRSPSRVTEEAEGALITLGYKPTEAARAIHAAYEDGMTTEEVIRSALRRMVGS
ncbi:MAG: Holliday junction branch migration protein RuvA [Gammaproteobacteria bacterium]|nr:Holliday junction branch migration protein RuvA [Gammaproteobacteria bacterium]